MLAKKEFGICFTSLIMKNAGCIIPKLENGIGTPMIELAIDAKSVYLRSPYEPSIIVY